MEFRITIVKTVFETTGDASLRQKMARVVAGHIGDFCQEDALKNIVPDDFSRRLILAIKAQCGWLRPQLSVTQASLDSEQQKVSQTKAELSALQKRLDKFTAQVQYGFKLLSEFTECRHCGFRFIGKLENKEPVGSGFLLRCKSAGVIGLSSAIQLSRQGYRVTVLARELPGDFDIDYASPWAGSHFRPVPAIKPEDRLEQELMRETYRKMKDLASNHPETGIEFIPAVEYFDTADPAYFDEKLIRENGYGSWPEFRILDASELPAQYESVKLGVTYTAWVLNSPVYLGWLQDQAVQQCVHFIRTRLTALEEALFVYKEKFQQGSDSNDVLAVINASGRGFNDPNAFPSRGQFIAVSNPCEKTISHHWADGSTTVIIPRPGGGGTIIGGTKEPNNWSHSISDAATASILSRAVTLCPELVGSQAKPGSSDYGLDIRQVYIARRPMRRRGGLRLEREDLAFQDTSADGMSNAQKTIPVIHCYGAGPSGYKLSWGIASRVGRFVLEI
ncbi:nucleotide-binding domain-containing protein [Aspergillus ellipticus CBS 707.79]|uniref:Nucleotide-binding domain-containing protein n=1 Tax=Aspergillus ellipticus CBS 707.79 TaxID=1448320 RepID=A0A319DE63_9EURO|nr:nucleotide-binding domain-containing protein [Aspergillus ellipticus CBS 707.79]